MQLLLPDGTLEHVGIWLDREHNGVPGAEVAAMLIEMGLPQDLAVKHGKRRADRLAGAPAAMEHPAAARLVVEEERHRALKDEFSKAFVQAQSKKEKGAKK